MKKYFFSILIFSFVFVSLAIPCTAADSPDTPTAVEIYASMFERYKTVKQYHHFFDYEETGMADGEKQNRVCEFWYVEPDVIRLDVISGDDKGSKVVYNGKKNDKTVYAKQPLMPVAIPLGKNDPRLGGFMTSNWKSDLNELKQLTGDAVPEFVGGSKVKDRPAWKIEFKNLKGKYNRIILWIDKEQKLLVQYEYYAGDELFARKTWYDFDLETKLGPKDFKI